LLISCLRDLAQHLLPISHLRGLAASISSLLGDLVLMVKEEVNYFTLK
jgi:hypothetical protein